MSYSRTMCLNIGGKSAGRSNARPCPWPCLLTGKKHLGALRAQGFGAQADALLAQAKDQKNLGELKKAHETAKRTLGPP